MQRDLNGAFNSGLLSPLLRLHRALATLFGRGTSVKWGYAMRFTIFALFLPAATIAAGQSPQSAPEVPRQRLATPPSITLQESARNPAALPLNITIINIQKHPKIFVPPAQISFRDPGATLDAKIVVHPPQLSVGALAPGTTVAQNLYPGLELLPIEQSKAKGEPIPTTWPNAKIEAIPIVWPKAELLPVTTGGRTQAASK
jgi:hypothetical protein